MHYRDGWWENAMAVCRSRLTPQACAILWRFSFWWRVAFLIFIFLSFRPLILLREYTHICFLCDIVLFENLLWFDICGMIIPYCFPNTYVMFLCCPGCAEKHSICVREWMRGLWEKIPANPKQQCCRRLFPPCMYIASFIPARIFRGKCIFNLFKVLGIPSAVKNASEVTWQVFNGTFCYSHITGPICSPEFSFCFLLYSLCKGKTTFWVIWVLRISAFEILIYQDWDFL